MPFRFDSNITVSIKLNVVAKIGAIIKQYINNKYFILTANSHKYFWYIVSAIGISIQYFLWDVFI